MSLGLVGAYGASAVQEGLRNRIIDQLKQRQAEQQMELAQRGADRADRQLDEQTAYRQAMEADRVDQQHQVNADRYERGTQALDEATPAGRYEATNPIMGRLVKIGAATPVDERPKVETGPLLPGDTGGELAAGFLKRATATQADKAQTQADKIADNKRQSTRDTETERHQREMERLGGITAANAGNRANSMSPSQSFKAVRDLQKDWSKSIAPTRQLSAHVQRMEQGLAAATKGDMNAGAQVVITEFNKIMDPTSVVRESEYARTPSGMGLLQRIQGIGERLAQGGPGVPVEQLATFVQLAKEMSAGMAHYTDSDKRRIEKVAARYGIDSTDVFDEADLGTGRPAAAGPGATGSKIKSITEIK